MTDMIEKGKILVCNRINQHPNSVGQTYSEHFKDSCYYSFWSGLSCVILLIHACLPFVFITTAGDILLGLSEKIQAKRVHARELWCEEALSGTKIKSVRFDVELLENKSPKDAKKE